MLEKIITNLTAAEASEIEFHMQAIAAPRGEIIVSQGAGGQDLYFVISGTCDVYRRVRLGGHVCAVHIAKLIGPTLLGEANLLLNQERNATVVASDDNVKYLMLPYSNFLHLRKDNPVAALKMIEHAGKVVAGRFIDQNEKLQQLVTDQPSPEQGAAMLEKLSSSVHFCKPEVAHKLFGIDNAYVPKGK